MMSVGVIVSLSECGLTSGADGRLRGFHFFVEFVYVFVGCHFFGSSTVRRVSR